MWQLEAVVIAINAIPLKESAIKHAFLPARPTTTFWVDVHAERIVCLYRASATVEQFSSGRGRNSRRDPQPIQTGLVRCGPKPCLATVFSKFERLKTTRLSFIVSCTETQSDCGLAYHCTLPLVPTPNPLRLCLNMASRRTHTNTFEGKTAVE